VRILSEDFDGLLQQTLRPLQSKSFELSIYFGRNLAKRYDRLAQALFNQFPAPFLRASFVRERRWRLQSVRPIATNEIPESHRPFATERINQHFASPRRSAPRNDYRYDLAILWDRDAPDSPSGSRAVRRFVRAARRVDIDATLITRDDYGAIAEFDALFIRENTAVNHHTYRMSRRAAAEGLVVIDDPESILRCTNKVFQAELFARHGMPSPRTLVVHEGNVEAVKARIGLPCVLKRPDSSFSQGVIRVESSEDLLRHLELFFDLSELVVAQEYVPSSYDWRIGVLNRAALFACKYHMARGHWQIVAPGPNGARRYGRVETVPIGLAPREAVRIAERAAGLIGDGLYGVDVKEHAGGFLVMEVNDNPNVDAGAEDAVLGDDLYTAIMQTFRDRLDARGGRGPR
jgi:glutathione synthase/RimK-type ligase-like ATP-grasp enzyme